MLATCGMPIFSRDDQMNSSAACMAITSKEMFIFPPPPHMHFLSCPFDTRLKRRNKQPSHCISKQPPLNSAEAKVYWNVGMCDNM